MIKKCSQGPNKNENINKKKLTGPWEQNKNRKVFMVWGDCVYMVIVIL